MVTKSVECLRGQAVLHIAQVVDGILGYIYIAPVFPMPDHWTPRGGVFSDSKKRKAI